MLTPLFDIHQDDKCIFITVKAPLAKASSVEISIEDNEFFFSAKPYFLRLYLPKNIVEDGSEVVEYSSDSGEFRIVVSKEKYGEFFPGLDLITKLLTPKGRETAGQLCEELTDGHTALAVDGTPYFEQKIRTDIPTTSSYGYGFGRTRKGIFSRLRNEIGYLIDVSDPDCTSNEERKRLEFDNERDAFSDDHYLADFFSPAQVVESLWSLVVWWDATGPFCEKFTSDEKDRLKDLPKRSYGDVSASEARIAMYSMVDILYAYVYNFRTTCGENNSESGWLVAKLSPTLSCLTSWSNVKECLVACMRRSLCFPLYRNWTLSLKMLEDVRKICTLGRIAITKCFLAVHKIFANSGEYRYILNELYVTDYCVWLQQAEDYLFAQVIEEMNHVVICKKDLELDLDELELAGKLAVEESSGGDCQTCDDLDIGERTLLEYVKRHAVSDLVQEHDSDDSESLGETEVTRLGVQMSDLTFS